MEAYHVMLEQLNSGNLDEHFTEYASLVYAKVLREGGAVRRQTALELQEALCCQLEKKIGLVFPVYSYILRIDVKSEYMENFLKIIRSIQKDGQLGWQKAYYLFQQLNGFRLQHGACDTENVRGMLREIMYHAVADCMQQLNVKEYPQSYAERDANYIVVLTEELSEADRGWMEYVLECCFKLHRLLGRKVLLANTSESASRAGEVNYFAPEYGQVTASLGEKKLLEWKGESFKYLQFQDILACPAGIENAVQGICKNAPGMILHLGDSSLLAAIADQWIPVMSMGKTYGRAAVSIVEFQVSFDSRQEAEQEFLRLVEEHQQIVQDERNLKTRLVFPSEYFRAEERRIEFYESGEGGESVLRESFFIERMMKRAWAVSIKILKQIECICRRHQIPYFADWGTLLGAVRHKGVVPWDDDIDIAMKREDYNRFLAIARKELPEGYCIVDATYDETWINLIARVLNVADSNNAQLNIQTEKMEEFYGCPFVIGVDIQPLDYIPRDSEEADLQADILQNVFAAAYELRENGGQITEKIKEQLKLIEELCNYHLEEGHNIVHQLFRLASAISQMYGKEDGDEITYMYSYVKRRSYKLKPEWYAECVSLPFETTTVQVPKEYIKVLEKLYGPEWNTCYKGASAHEYPFYRGQQKQLEQQGIVVD